MRPDDALLLVLVTWLLFFATVVVSESERFAHSPLLKTMSRGSALLAASGLILTWIIIL